MKIFPGNYWLHLLVHFNPRSLFLAMPLAIFYVGLPNFTFEVPCTRKQRLTSTQTLLPPLASDPPQRFPRSHFSRHTPRSSCNLCNSQHLWSLWVPCAPVRGQRLQDPASCPGVRAGFHFLPHCIWTVFRWTQKPVDWPPVGHGEAQPRRADHVQPAAGNVSSVHPCLCSSWTFEFDFFFPVPGIPRSFCSHMLRKAVTRGWEQLATADNLRMLE